MIWWLTPALFTLLFGWIILFIIWAIYWYFSNYDSVFVKYPFMADIATIWFVLSCAWIGIVLLNIGALVLKRIWAPFI